MIEASYADSTHWDLGGPQAGPSDYGKRGRGRFLNAKDFLMLVKVLLGRASKKTSVDRLSDSGNRTASFYSKAEKRFGGESIAQDSAESGFRKIGCGGAVRIYDRCSPVAPGIASKEILSGGLVISHNTAYDDQEKAKNCAYIPSAHFQRDVTKSKRSVKREFPTTSCPDSKSYDLHGIPKYRHH